MVNNIWAYWTPGPLECILILVTSLIFFVIPITIVVLIIRSLVRNKRENQRLRLEVGKLADELERLRKQNQSD